MDRRKILGWGPGLLGLEDGQGQDPADSTVAPVQGTDTHTLGSGK